MSVPPFEAGAFIWRKCPTSENPEQPGLTHAAYAMAVTGIPDGRQFAIVAYTTSQIPPPPLPKGIIHVAAKQAASMGHNKPFLLNPGRIAAVPITSAYFPYLDQPDRGVIGQASQGLQNVITKEFKEIVAKRRESLEQLGPSWPRFR